MNCGGKWQEFFWGVIKFFPRKFYLKKQLFAFLYRFFKAKTKHIKLYSHLALLVFQSVIEKHIQQVIAKFRPDGVFLVLVLESQKFR